MTSHECVASAHADTLRSLALLQTRFSTDISSVNPRSKQFVNLASQYLLLEKLVPCLKLRRPNQKFITELLIAELPPNIIYAAYTITKTIADCLFEEAKHSSIENARGFLEHAKQQNSIHLPDIMRLYQRSVSVQVVEPFIPPEFSVPETVDISYFIRSSNVEKEELSKLAHSKFMSSFFGSHQIKLTRAASRYAHLVLADRVPFLNSFIKHAGPIRDPELIKKLQTSKLYAQALGRLDRHKIIADQVKLAFNLFMPTADSIIVISSMTGIITCLLAQMKGKATNHTKISLAAHIISYITAALPKHYNVEFTDKHAEVIEKYIINDEEIVVKETPADSITAVRLLQTYLAQHMRSSYGEALKLLNSSRDQTTWIMKWNKLYPLEPMTPTSINNLVTSYEVPSVVDEILPSSSISQVAPNIPPAASETSIVQNGPVLGTTNAEVHVQPKGLPKVPERKPKVYHIPKTRPVCSILKDYKEAKVEIEMANCESLLPDFEWNKTHVTNYSDSYAPSKIVTEAGKINRPKSLEDLTKQSAPELVDWDIRPSLVQELEAKSKIEPQVKIPFNPTRIISLIAAVGLCAAGAKIMKITNWFDKLPSVLTILQKSNTVLDSAKSIEKFFLKYFLEQELPEEKEMAQLLEHDKKLAEYLSTPVEEFAKDMTKYGDYKKLIETVSEVVSKQSSFNKEARSILISTLNACKKHISDLYSRVRDTQPRQVPVAVYIFGEEGVGKTEGAKWIASKIKERLSMSRNLWTFKVTKYFPSYNQEEIAFYDEAFNTRSVAKDNQFYQDFPTILSSAHYNMEGAALMDKTQPCNFKVLLMASNLHPDGIKDKVDISNEGIEGIYNRMIILHAKYNKGASEASKDREQRARDHDLGHIDFYPMKYVGTNGKVCDYITRGSKKEPIKVTAPEVIDNICKKYELNRTRALQLSPQGVNHNACSVLFRGSTGSGKTEVINKISTMFSTEFNIPTVRAVFPDKPAIPNSAVVVVDDQLLYNGSKIDEDREAWLMDIYNSLPPRVLLLNATNINPSKKNAFRTIFMGRKVRKNPFKNIGVCRRMGFTGDFLENGTIVSHNHGLEFKVNAGIYQVYGTETMLLQDDAVSRVRQQYCQYLQTLNEIVVTEVDELPYGRCDLTIVANEGILQDIKSKVSMASLFISHKSSNGTTISLTPRMVEAMDKCDPRSFVSNIEITYDSECAIKVAKHFASAIRPLIPDVVIKIDLQGIPTIQYSEGIVHVQSSALSTVGIKHISPSGLFTFELDDEHFVIDMIRAFVDKVQGKPMNYLVPYPRPVVTKVHEVLRDFQTEYVPLTPLIRNELRLRAKLQRAQMLTNAGNTTIEIASAITKYVKEHPFLVASTVFLLGGAIYTMVKGASYAKATMDHKHLLLEAQFLLKCKQSGVKFDAKRLAFLQNCLSSGKFIEEQLEEINPQAKGKTKRGRGRKAWSRRIVTKNGSVQYYDEHGNLIYETESGYADLHRGRYYDYELDPKYVADLDYDTDDDHMGPQAVVGLPAVFDKPKFSHTKISAKVRRNIVQVGIHDDETADVLTVALDPGMYAIGLKENLMIVPKHLARVESLNQYNNKPFRKHIYTADSRAPGKIFRANLVYHEKARDLAIYQIVSDTFPPFSDITRYLIDNDDYPDDANVVFEYPSESGWVTYAGMCNFHTQDLVDMVGEQIHHIGMVNYGSTKAILTTPGMCGLPYYINDESRSSKIISGFHIGAYRPGETMPSFISVQAMFTADDVKRFLERVKTTQKEKKMKPLPKPEIAAPKPKRMTPDELKKLVAVEAQVKSKKIWLSPELAELLTRNVHHPSYREPDIPFPVCKRVKVLGTLNKSTEKPIINPYSPTVFSGAIEKIYPNLKMPFCNDVTKLLPDELDKLAKDSFGVPSSRVTQELMWACDLPEGSSDERLDYMAEEMGQYYSPRLGKKIRFLTPEEAIGGISRKGDQLAGLEKMDVDTAPGWEFSERFGITTTAEMITRNEDGTSAFSDTEAGKELKRYAIEDFEKARKGIMPLTIFKNCVKMEKLPNGKRYKGRIFTIACKRLVILVRRILGGLYHTFQGNEKLPLFGGFDPIVAAEYIVQEILRRGDNAFSGDYSRWDKRLHVRLVRFLKKFYTILIKENWDPRFPTLSDEEIENLVTIAVSMAIISWHVSGTTFYFKNGGMGSGAPNTFPDNSWYNEALGFDAYLSLISEHNKEQIKFDPTYAMFRELVYSMHCGDDKWVGVVEGFKHIYNLATLSEYLEKTWGCMLDTATKDGQMYKTQSVYKCWFVSRQPRKIQESGKHIMALKPEAISGLLHWTSDQNAIQVACQLEVAAKEMAMWGRNEYNKATKLIAIAFKMQPALMGYLALPSYKFAISTLYANVYGFPSFISGDAEGHMLKFDPQSKEIMDFVSKLNLLWQSGAITAPRYSDNGTAMVNFEEVAKPHRKYEGFGKGFNKKDRKMKAAQDGYDKYQRDRLTPQGLFPEHTGPKAKLTMTSDPERPKTALDVLTPVERLNVFKSFTKNAPSCTVTNAQLYRAVDQQLRLRSDLPDNDRQAILRHAISSQIEPQMNENALASAKPQSNIPTSSGDGGAVPNPIAQKAIAPTLDEGPSVLMNPGGGITGTGMPALTHMDMQQGVSAPCIPEVSGRAMDIEAILWNQYIEQATGEISSTTTRGTVIARLTAHPKGVSVTHDTYMGFYDAATFARDYRLMTFGATDIAGALIVGWVPNIAKTNITMTEVMTYSYQIIDINGTRSTDFHTRDARRLGAFRWLSDSSDTEPVPGTVIMMYQPLNNKFATDTTYSVNYAILSKFSSETTFFAPKALSPNSDTQLTLNSLTVGTEAVDLYKNPMPFKLSMLSDEIFDLFVGGSTYAQPIRMNVPVTHTPIDKRYRAGTTETDLYSGSLLTCLSGTATSMYTSGSTPQGNTGDVDQSFILTDNQQILTTSTGYITPASVSKDFLDKTGFNEIYKTTADPPLYLSGWEDYVDPMGGADFPADNESVTAGVIHHSAVEEVSTGFNEKQFVYVKHEVTISTTTSDVIVVPANYPFKARGLANEHAPTNTADIVDKTKYLIPRAGKTTALEEAPTVILGASSIPFPQQIATGYRADFISPGQTATEEREAYYPIKAKISAKLEEILVGWCEYYDTEVIVFDLANSTGTLATIGYEKYSHFQILTPQKNRIIPSIDPDSVIINHPRPVSSLSQIPPTNSSLFRAFVSSTYQKETILKKKTIVSGRDRDVLFKHLQTLKLEPQMFAASAITGALGGLFSGAASSISAQQDREQQWKIAQAGYQNKKEVQDSINNTAIETTGMNNTSAYRNVIQQGINSINTAEVQGDLALRNAGQLSNSALNRQVRTNNRGTQTLAPRTNNRRSQTSPTVRDATTSTEQYNVRYPRTHQIVGQEFPGTSEA